MLGYVDLQETGINLKYLGKYDDLLRSSHPDISFFPAFGAVDRKGLIRRASSLKEYDVDSMVSLVSPSAIVSTNVVLGGGVFVAHGVILNSGAKLGDYAIINSGSIIGHEVEIYDYSIVSGKVFIGGNVRVGPKTLIGPGSTIMQSVKIGAEVIVSIGSIVARDIPNNKTSLPALSKII